MVVYRITVAGLLSILMLVAAPGGAVPVSWVNGDFELGAATWTAAPGTTFEDHDGDDDLEAHLLGSGAGVFQLSRGLSMGGMPATTPISFVIEQGQLVYDARVILINLEDPDAYLNNYGTTPNWFDDDVLSWVNWGGATGPILLDPVQANGINIDGWSTMTPEERFEELSHYTYATFVLYAVASGYNGGATVDDFSWE